MPPGERREVDGWVCVSGLADGVLPVNCRVGGGYADEDDGRNQTENGRFITRRISLEKRICRIVSECAYAAMDRIGVWMVVEVVGDTTYLDSTREGARWPVNG